MNSLLVVWKSLDLLKQNAKEHQTSILWSMCSRGDYGNLKKEGRMIGWFLWKSVTIFRRKETSKYRVTLSGWNWMKGGTDLRAAVFKVSNFRSDVAMGLNGGCISALRTICSDHWGVVWWGGGRVLLRPLRNFLTAGWEKSLAEEEESDCYVTLPQCKLWGLGEINPSWRDEEGKWAKFWWRQVRQLSSFPSCI